MDDLSFLVQETFRVHELHLAGVNIEELEDGEECWNPPAVEAPKRALPLSAGLLFHLELQGGTFIVRTLAVQEIATSFNQALEHPEEFPSLRLVGNNQSREATLQYFECSSLEEAEAIHARVGHRRFPMREEDVCNLSDPGFSWWMEAKSGRFVLHSKMGILKENLVRLGPLADAQIAPHRWSELAHIMSYLPLGLEVTVEGSKFVMESQKESWPVDEFCRVFLEGKMSKDLMDIFRLLEKRGTSATQLETSWFFLKEVAAVRRFWLMLQDELA
jgi:hypothetical protein